MTIQRMHDGPARIVPQEIAPTAPHAIRGDAMLALANDALVARNLQLLTVLQQQHVALDALQSFVVAVSRALQATHMAYAVDPRQALGQQQLASLTERQREVLTLVVAGHPSKRIAAVLGISQRTVENHRASIMTKTGSASVPALTQLAFLAGVDPCLRPPARVRTRCRNAPQQP